jgi:hypothetical protein
VPVKLTPATEKSGQAPRLLYYCQFVVSHYKEAITIPKRILAKGSTGSEPLLPWFYQEKAVSAPV